MNYLNYTKTAILALALITVCGCEDDTENKGNHLPTVSIINKSQTVNVGDTVHLKATAIDIDGDELSYLWTMKSRPQNSESTLSTSTNKETSFVADISGKYVLNFKANDGLTDSKVSVATVQSKTELHPDPEPVTLKEDCIAHDLSKVKVIHDGSNWTITDGISLMFAFKDKDEADRSLAIIKHYKMDKSCFVGRPNPNFSYMLVDDKSPENGVADEDCVDFNLNNIEVKKINNRYKIIDGSHWIFDFEDKQDEADKSLAIIKKYGFTKTCYVGRPDPDFSYLRKGDNYEAIVDENLIAHYKLKENASDLTEKTGDMSLLKTEFKNNSLYLNGLYFYSDDHLGYKASTPKLDIDYNTLSFSFSFNPIKFGINNQEYPKSRTTLLVGGHSYRWLAITKISNKDNLVVSFNNGHKNYIFKNVGLTTGQWHKLSFSLNVQDKKFLLLLDGNFLGEKSLPNDFKIDVVGTSSEESDKQLMFTNYSNGGVFYGYIKDFFIYNSFLTKEKLEAL